MGKEPLVSVVMATYNEPPQIISKAIESIINQTYTAWELLIFDDSDRADTRQAIDAYTVDTRLRVYREKQRIGFVPALNQGLEKAAGKYIARMDGDDISLPERFEKEVTFLERYPDVFAVGGQVDIIDENDNVVSHKMFPQKGFMLDLYACFRNPLPHPAVMVRRELVDKGFRYNENLKASEDLDLWLRVMNNAYKIANIKDTVLAYRVQPGFSDKRTSLLQIQYLADVRKNNFDRRRPIFSSVSYLSGWMRAHMPTEFMRNFYTYENNKQKYKTQTEHMR